MTCVRKQFDMSRSAAPVNRTAQKTACGFLDRRQLYFHHRPRYLQIVAVTLA